MAVRVSRIWLRIWSSTARRASPSSRLRRCSAERTFTQQTFHSSNREVEVNGTGRAQMFDHLIALGGIGLKQELVDDGGGIGLLAQAACSLRQALSPMRFQARSGAQGIGAPGPLADDVIRRIMLSELASLRPHPAR
jgi:hypothetical protein